MFSMHGSECLETGPELVPNGTNIWSALHG